MKAEATARQRIDAMLGEAGWMVQDPKLVNLAAGRGVAVREFPLKGGTEKPTTFLFVDGQPVDGQPVGIVEAKKEGETLSGVEVQAEKYSVGSPRPASPEGGHA